MGAISVNNLGKAYKQYPNRWSRLAEWLLPGNRPRHHLHWVLQNINFTVNPGESVGIVGINGAGKSTLLKLITGTIQPTSGTVAVQGRVSALLELGMGFHQDFTGKQNAVMAGQLLGLSLDEIADLMPQIEAFAEIGEYIDQPVRVYSSGMMVRLAFSVATAKRPDILIVDEALSVGDTFFQHKCMQRIRKFREKGTTLLFVSHSSDAIRMLCDRGIMLANGAIAKIGDAATVMDYYRASQVLRMESPAGPQPEVTEFDALLKTRDSKTVLANKTIGAITVDIQGGHNPIYSGDHVSIRITAGFQDIHRDPHIGFGIRNKMGILIYEANTYTLNRKLRAVSPGDKLSVTFHFPCLLAPGTYELTIGVADGGYDRGSFERALFFDQSFLLLEIAVGANAGWCGLCDLQPEITMD
ncbi:ABC transporter ATP-binding protein [Desulfobulbus sp.]|uniref:ABC transporter ATP-binding protein n=1 Tax=Desulfobulbus sp. TaxID=895 RepID=UPI0027B94663|nr:ABC transporter ATP-binding protein [Desulfobulbus sp.]